MALYANLFGPLGLEYPDGQHAARATATILNLDSTPATLYTGRDKSATTGSNTVEADEQGNIQFWVEPDEYLININGINLRVSVPLHPEEPGASGSGVTSVDGRTGNVVLSDVYDQIGTASAVMSAHTNASDPHPQYMLADETATAIANALATAPFVIKYDNGWPARGSSPRPAFFVGGAEATDQPTDMNLTLGDMWFPSS